MRTNWQEKVQKIKEKLKETSKVSILTHYNPDGDAVGSGLALYHFLKDLNIDVTFVVPNSLPGFLRWIPGYEHIVVHKSAKEKAEKIISESDWLFALDFNHSDRIKEMEPLLLESKATKVLIDHHPEPQGFCDYSFSDIKACSTSELIYEFIRLYDINYSISKDIATAVYVGLMTDTGNFSYNSSNPETFRVLADLLECGIDKDEITSNVFDNFSADRMRLLGLSLNDRMHVLPEHNTAYIYLSLDDMRKFNYKQGDSEGFVNYPLSIKNIVFSAIFIEHKDFVKISFRSKGCFAVNKFSEKHFNGGGHRNAAGGNSKLSFMEAIQHFENIVEEYKEELNKACE